MPIDPAGFRNLRQYGRWSTSVPKCVEGAETYDGVEESLCERQRARVGVNRVNLSGKPSFLNPLPVLGWFGPQVNCPHLDVVLPCQKGRRQRRSVG